MDYFKGRVTVDITGGVDSRLVLATILTSGVDLSDINFVCAKGDNKDYHVASLLARKLGINIKNKSYTYGQGSQEDLYNFWKIGNLGVYNPVYFPNSTRPQSLLHFHGACGECFRDFYGSTASVYLEGVARSQKDCNAIHSLNRKFGKALYFIDSPIDTKMVMFDYYINYRSRFHFGRSAFRNLNEYLISPLSSPYLLAAFSMLSTKEKENGALILDIFQACCPELLDVTFDEESKNFSRTQIENSRCYGIKRESRPLFEFKVYYNEEPRQEKTEKKQSMIDFMINDLVKYKEVVVASGYYSEEEVLLAQEAILKGGRITMTGQEAAKIISLGEVLSLCRKVKSTKVL
jgi:hypothetical protein